MSTTDNIRKVMRNDPRCELLEAVARLNEGLLFESRKGSHWQLKAPGKRPVFFTVCRTDHRAVRNMRTELRQAGYVIP